METQTDPDESVDRPGFTAVASDLMMKILIVLLLFPTALLISPAEAQACDSAVYNNFFAMADSAERVLVVRARGWNKGKVVRALKGDASLPLPAIKSNCDPYLSEGRDYLVFVRPGGGYYTDSSAFALLGDQGQAWIKLASDWIATSDDDARSKLLASALDFEFAMPMLYGQWAILNEIAKLPMPHPTIDRAREIRLAVELASRQALPRPAQASLSWFRDAKSADSIALVRASKTTQSRVIETLAGADRKGKDIRVAGALLSPGADYLVLVDKKGLSIGTPFLIASAEHRQIMEVVRTWAKQGMKDKLLRAFVRDKLAGRSTVHPLVYDAASNLTARKKLNHRTCRIMRGHYVMPKTLAKAIKKTCRGG